MRGLRTIAWLAALSAAVSGGASASAGQPPVEAFAALPAMRSPELSPDGRYLAAIQDVGGQPGVVVYTIGAPPGSKPAMLGYEGWAVWATQWVNNERLMIMAGKGSRMAGRGGDIWTVNRAIIVSPDGGNAVRVFDNVDSLRYNSSASWIMDLSIQEPDHIYMPLLEEGGRNYLLNLFEIDVNTGKARKFAQADDDTGYWIMDGAGHVVARLDQTRQSRIQKLMVPDGERSWREVAAVPATADSGLNILGLAEDGKAVIRVTESGGRDVLARVDLATGQETILLSGKRNDIDEIYRDRWTGRIVGAAVDGETAYFDPERGKMRRGLQKAFPGLSVWEESSDLSRRKLVVATSGPRSPTTYYYLDRDTKIVDEIMSSYPGLQEADLGEMKPYDYTARDGLAIPAFITLPPGREPKNLPAIVMPHGGPDARDSLGFDWWAQFMANRGYVVLQPNYRGSTGYGAAFNAAGHGQWGLKMQDDITDGVRKMIADGIADPKRVCIVGASYGGYAALAGATLTPDLYACVVSVAGVSDLPKMIARERQTHGRKSGAVLFWISRIGSPDDDSEKLRATSPARLAANVRAPIMLMHGELDTTVPIEQSEYMQEALEDAGKPVTFIELKGDDHYLQRAATRQQMLVELEKFLVAHIGR